MSNEQLLHLSRKENQRSVNISNVLTTAEIIGVEEKKTLISQTRIFFIYFYF